MTLPARQPSEAPTEAMIDRAARQMEAHVRQLIEEKVAEKIQEKIQEEIEGKIAESVSPLQAEIASLREQLEERKAKPPRFEVSLSSIPLELERQLETRLKNNLAPRALEEARQQYTNLLAAAKATIDQKTREGHEDFLRKVAEELKGVEKRTQDISVHISGSAREHLHRGLDDFHQQLVEGGNSLKRLSEELLQFVHDSLHTEHGARRTELEELRATVAAESSRLHEHIEYLDVRIRNLDESVRNMESGLDKRLGQMSSNTVKESRRQLESVGNEILEEWTARGAAAAANQVEEATAKMKTVQEEIVATEHESLKNQATNALQEFEQSMEEAAHRTVERWRLKLAGGLQVLAKSVGEQFQLGSGSGEERER
jgi:DNA repair exonuclease SbcCD ATPase subunit